MSLSTERAAWDGVAADLGPDARILRVRRLVGGLQCQTFAAEVEGAPFERIVVKRFAPEDVEDAKNEWECLDFAQRIAVTVPRRIALDLGGAWFGGPALAMTLVAGRADVDPRALDPWLRQLAETLATIHAASIDGACGPVARPSDVEAWAPPDFDAGPFVDRAITAIDAHLPRGGWPLVVAHGDYHPGQTLWRRGRLNGVVDWGDLHLGSRWYDVAYCRADIALLYGMKGADGFLGHYVAATGVQPVDLPAFDLACLVHARQWHHLFLDAYREQGRTDTRRQFAARLTPCIRRALAELGA